MFDRRADRRRSSAEQFLYNQYVGSYGRAFRREATYEYDRSLGVCNYCQRYHRNEHEKCYFVCHYCHSIHFKPNLNEQHKNDKTYLCPMLKSIALQQQNKKAYPCEQCGGHGVLEKIIQTAYLQPNQAFQRRLFQYRTLDQESRRHIPAPERKVFKKEEASKQYICEHCNGKGKHLRMVACCQSGCTDCGFSRMRMNSNWRHIRSKGEPNDQVFPCRICSEEVAVGDKIFKLHCGHTFHRNCIFSWLYRREGCYTCTEVDPYFQRQDIPLQSLTKLIQVEKMPKKVDQNQKKTETTHKNNLLVDQKLNLRRDSIQLSWLQNNLQVNLPSWVKSDSYIMSDAQWPSFDQRRCQDDVNQPQQQDSSLHLIAKPPLESAERQELTLDLSIIRDNLQTEGVVNSVTNNDSWISEEGNREGEAEVQRQQMQETDFPCEWEEAEEMSEYQDDDWL